MPPMDLRETDNRLSMSVPVPRTGDSGAMKPRARRTFANVNAQIGTQEKLDTENEKMYRDAIRQACALRSCELRTN